MSALAWVGFVAAAAVGAPLRYVLDGFIGDRIDGIFPWGTFVINATGSLLFGVITGLALYHAFPESSKVILGTGFCGSYTTFSSYAFESFALMEQGQWLLSAINIIGSNVLCLAAVLAGAALARGL